MAALILDGKALSAEIRAALKRDAESLRGSLGRPPGLGVILVGENPASKVYVAAKTKACAEVGIRAFDYHLSGSISDSELREIISKLNNNAEVDGILLQLPLPKGLSEFDALCAIDPRKDADGLHPTTQGLLLRGEKCFKPCTPSGVLALIDRARRDLGQSTDLSGLHAVVVGRSVLVGKPVGVMLLERNATVTFCHSRTKDLDAECRRADILVAALGRPDFIKAVKPGSIVIDVGINRLENGKLTGDVDFAAAKEVAAAITPVPGGVGPMTIAMLLSNTIQSAKEKTRG